MAQNKVVYYGDTLIDLTGDTVSEDKVLNGYVFHKPDGTQSVGTFVPEGGSAIVVTEEDDEHGGIIKHIVAVDLSDDTVTAATLQSGVTAHNAQGQAITGTYTPSTPTVNLQSKTATPTESSQTIIADAGYDGLSDVEVGAISSTYVGSGITRDPTITVSGPTVNVPSGYYTQMNTQSVATTTQAVPAVSIDGTTGLITATATQTAGYVSAGSQSGTQQLATKAPAVIIPTTSSQPAVAANTYTQGAVDVGPIPSEYIIPAGSQTITENGTYNVSTLAEAVVNVSGGGEDTLVEALHNLVTSVSDDTLTSIRSYGLASMTALTSVDFPNLQTINSYAFYNDYNLVMDGWQFPKAKTIGNYAFRYCYGLSGDIVLPSTVTSIGQYSFASCKNIETFTATGSITTFGTYTFTGASADHMMQVREIHLPNLGTSIALNLNFGSATASYACQKLEVVDIGKAKSIAANTFANCYKLQTLIMRRTGSVTTLANVSGFLNTPLRGRNSLTANIYVPSALINTYKAATNWKTIDGYGYVTWNAIEGSPYEL